MRVKRYFAPHLWLIRLLHATHSRNLTTPRNPLISCVPAANCYFLGVVRVTKVYITSNCMQACIDDTFWPFNHIIIFFPYFKKSYTRLDTNVVTSIAAITTIITIATTFWFLFLLKSYILFTSVQKWVILFSYMRKDFPTYDSNLSNFVHFIYCSDYFCHNEGWFSPGKGHRGVLGKGA